MPTDHTTAVPRFSDPQTVHKHRFGDVHTVAVAVEAATGAQPKVQDEKVVPSIKDAIFASFTAILSRGDAAEGLTMLLSIIGKLMSVRLFTDCLKWLTGNLSGSDMLTCFSVICMEMNSKEIVAEAEGLLGVMRSVQNTLWPLEVRDGVVRTLLTLKSASGDAGKVSHERPFGEFYSAVRKFIQVVMDEYITVDALHDILVNFNGFLDADLLTDCLHWLATGKTGGHGHFVVICGEMLNRNFVMDEKELLEVVEAVKESWEGDERGDTIAERVMSELKLLQPNRFWFDV